MKSLAMCSVFIKCSTNYIGVVEFLLNLITSFVLWGQKVRRIVPCGVIDPQRTKRCTRILYRLWRRKTFSQCWIVKLKHLGVYQHEGATTLSECCIAFSLVCFPCVQFPGSSERITLRYCFSPWRQRGLAFSWASAPLTGIASVVTVLLSAICE